MSTEGSTSLIEPGDLYDLRRRVLRSGDPGAEMAYPSDFCADGFHLGWRIGAGPVLAVASFAPAILPDEARPWLDAGPSRLGHELGTAWRLRGMAVEPAHQGQGLGTVLLEAAATRIVERQGAVLWCNARDTALGFYQARGWEVLGQGFVLETGVAHHLAVRMLRPPVC